MLTLYLFYRDVFHHATSDTALRLLPHLFLPGLNYIHILSSIRLLVQAHLRAA